jgi:hypothetical protein
MEQTDLHARRTAARLAFADHMNRKGQAAFDSKLVPITHANPAYWHHRTGYGRSSGATGT